MCHPDTDTIMQLPSLQDRRKTIQPKLFSKVVERLVPALQFHDFLTPVREKRLFKTEKYKDYVTNNIIDRQSINHRKC